MIVKEEQNLEVEKQKENWIILRETFVTGKYTYKKDPAVLREALVKEQDILLRVKLPVGIVESKNDNNRIYRKDAVSNSFTEVTEDMKGGAVQGTHGKHPDEVTVAPDKISHIITKAWIDDKNFTWNEWLVIPTQLGKDLSACFLSGVRLGISTRGYGVSESIDGSSVITKFKFYGADTVAVPSAGIYAGMSIPNVEIDVIDKKMLSECLTTDICQILNKLDNKEINEMKKELTESPSDVKETLSEILSNVKNLGDKMLVPLRESTENSQKESQYVELKENLDKLTETLDSQRDRVSSIEKERDMLLEEKSDAFKKLDTLKEDVVQITESKEKEKKVIMDNAEKMVNEVRSYSKEAEKIIEDLVNYGKVAEQAIKELVDHAHEEGKNTKELNEYSKVSEKAIKDLVDHVHKNEKIIEDLVNYGKVAEQAIKELVDHSHKNEQAIQELTEYSQVSEKAIDEVKSYALKAEDLIQEALDYIEFLEKASDQLKEYSNLAEEGLEETVEYAHNSEKAITYLRDYSLRLEEGLTKTINYTKKLEAFILVVAKDYKDNVRSKVVSPEVLKAVNTIISKDIRLDIFREEMLYSSTVTVLRNKVNRYLSILGMTGTGHKIGAILSESKVINKVTNKTVKRDLTDDRGVGLAGWK